MKKLFIIVICLFVYLQSQAQEVKQEKKNQLRSTTQRSEAKSTKKMTLFNFKTLKKPKPSNFIGSGDFNPNYPNFYTFWGNKYWPMYIVSIQYEPRTNLTILTNNKHISLQVTAKTQIPGQDIISTGPPIYNTSDLKFYENLFRNSRDYIIIFNFNGQNNLMYYHKSLMPNYFKPKSY